MCGSAHSKFLGSMPGGTSQAIRHLQPLTEEETVKYLTLPTSPNHIPGLSESQASWIYSELGGIPRILRCATQHVIGIINKGIKLPKALKELARPTVVISFNPFFEMEDRFERYLDSISDSKKEIFTDYIHAILFSEQFIPPGYNNPLLDPGLFYIDTDRSVCLVNKHAYNLLITGFLRFFQRKEISKLPTPTEQGLELERQVWYGLLNRGSLKYRSFFSNDYPETSSSSNNIDFTTTTTTTTTSSSNAATLTASSSSVPFHRMNYPTRTNPSLLRVIVSRRGFLSRVKLSFFDLFPALFLVWISSLLMLRTTLSICCKQPLQIRFSMQSLLALKTGWAFSISMEKIVPPT